MQNQSIEMEVNVPSQLRSIRKRLVTFIKGVT